MGNYQNVEALNILSFANNVVKGSNPFAFVLLNQILKEKGMWVATPKDLERILKNNKLDLKGTYGDSALVLRSSFSFCCNWPLVSLSFWFIDSSCSP